jgi:hypothetical protein
MRIHLDYTRSIRCHLGRHDQGDAEHGCQGGFRPLGSGCARFCACDCHDRPSGFIQFDEPLTEAQAEDLKRRFLEAQKTQPIRWLDDEDPAALWAAYDDAVERGDTVTTAPPDDDGSGT